jgi:predicted NAD/FAD-dependent oxidoreductase
VLVVEGRRGVGGRLATRQITGQGIGRASLDVGAQFFTVRTGELQARVDGWLEGGLVIEWCRGFSFVDGYPRYRVAGGMRELAAHLRSELRRAGATVVTGHRAAAVVPGHDVWTAIYQGPTREPDEAGAVIVTPPVPRSLELLRAGGVKLPAGLVDGLEAVAYHRVLALLAVLDRRPELGGPGARQQPGDPTFTFIADNQAKGVSEVPAVTFHAAHDLSAQLWGRSDAEISAALLVPARSVVAPAEIVAHELKRWRFAGPVAPLAERCAVIAGDPGPLVIAGDGFAGSKFEGAFLSGLAAAEAVLAARQS